MRHVTFPARLATAFFAGALAATAVPVAAPAQGDAGGISAEEDRRVFPPAPLDVRATIEGGAVVVTWSPPVPVPLSERPAYDPVIVGYRVFRVDAEGRERRIGETAQPRFRDTTPGKGVRRYAVRTVQRSGHESGLSHTVEVRLR